MKRDRHFVPAVGFAADANVQPRHPAEAAAWVWHPQAPLGETAFLRFKLELRVEAAAQFRVHVSADQRFQLRVDGQVIGYGPDRGEVAAWPVASYPISLATGVHHFEALVWWLKDHTLAGLRADPEIAGVVEATRPPVAQATWRGGFLLASENEWAERLNTGRAAWRVEDLTAAVKPVQPAFYAYHDIGPEFHLDGFRWNAPAPSVAPSVVVAAILGNPHGVQRPGWRLRATSLPEQHRESVRRGRERAICGEFTDGPFFENELLSKETSGWKKLVLEGGELVIPAHSERTVVWDFQDYLCGYACLATRGGRGAHVRIDWAEALHECADRAAVTKQTPKGNRDEIAGKIFFGFGDEFSIDGSETRWPAWWWRAGRFLRIQIRTQAEPLMLTSLDILSTGFPLGAVADFKSNDEPLNRIASLCVKTIRACAHEVWADCPYYEQMAYVGDSRLAALNNYALFEDDRLSRRMIELFDESRANHGLVAERAPAAWQQVSVTYSLLWVLMVRDFAWWRDDREFVCARLRGVRAMVDEVLAMCATDGLLRAVPGWPFVDWVPEWNEGCGPGVRAGDSSIVNLHLLLALQSHAELEEKFGEPELAALAKRRAFRLSTAIMNRFWSAPRGLLADTSVQLEFSDHAQALGILTGIVPPGGVQSWGDRWLKADDLARATIYFSFYVMDALHQLGRAEVLHEKFRLWRDGLSTGLLTLPEAPEPTRSDCHGWSAHVRWHFAASVAGVRPAAPAFARVVVAPQFGPLHTMQTDIRHPRGVVRVALRREGGRVCGNVDLPDGVEGEWRWQNGVRALHAGRNLIDTSQT